MAETHDPSTNGHHEHVDTEMNDLPQNSTPDTIKRKDGKLKTYAKKRASIVKKSRTRASNDSPAPMSAHNRQRSEELGDDFVSQLEAAANVEGTPAQAKDARKKSKKRKVENEAAPVEQETVDASSKARKRRTKKQQQQEEEQQQEVEVAESEPEAEAGVQEPAEDEDGEFDVPSDSEKEEAEVPASLKRVGSKRKRRVSTEYASPAPTKRQKTSASTKSTPRGTPKARIPRGQRSMVDYPEQGPFTPVEAEAIDSAMLEFCGAQGINKDELTEKIQTGSKDMTPVYLDIVSNVLPNRNRRAVQRYCRRHYNNHQRGKWTDDQDDALRRAYHEHPNKWVAIGTKVGRMPEDCRDRWRNHVSHGDNRNTDVWTEDEEMKLVRIVRECLAALEETNGVTITRENEDDYIAWPVVVQKMKGTRNRLQCSMKWRKIKARVEREETLHTGEADNNDDMASSPINSRYKAEAARRHDEMAIGDIYSIAKETQYGALMGSFASKNTFWAVVTRLHPASPWNTQDRKMVYKRLRPQIVDTGDFGTNVEAMVKWLEQNFDAEALAQRTVNAKGGKGHRSEEVVNESEDEERAAAGEDAQEEDESEEIYQDAKEVGEADEQEVGGAEQDEKEEHEKEEHEQDGKMSPHVSESADEQEEQNGF